MNCSQNKPVKSQYCAPAQSLRMEQPGKSSLIKDDLHSSKDQPAAADKAQGVDQ